MHARHSEFASRSRLVDRRAISLPEVLVVIAVLILLLALLIPSLGVARTKARRLFCANNLRQWGTALHAYRTDHHDFIPTEGSAGNIDQRGTWFNSLPPYLGLPPYKDFSGAGDQIEELPNIHVWICPAKNLTDAYKSNSGMNQFHYGMNQVLDGLGTEASPSQDAPGFLDQGPANPPHADTFARKPRTVFLFDIVGNSPAGKPRDVATKYQMDWKGKRPGRFHGDYANILYLSGRVGHCKTDDLVTDRDFRHGDIIWDNPKLYWGYPPPGWGPDELAEFLPDED